MHLLVRNALKTSCAAASQGVRHVSAARAFKLVPLYTAKVKATGGRVGRILSDDYVLNMPLITPKGLGGPGGPQTNPEQLFAGGYSACFLGAYKLAAANSKVALSPETSITAAVDIGKAADGGFVLAVELVVNAPGLDKATAQKLAENAHQICPYSRATRDNIEVKLTVV
ncbi:OsmC-like protein [Polychytrium aggregatum]|uniref:OsmC-like protein n=1 Tax=Polychytrium aggregatum TaxID=110093 RepID=UPI0022FE5C60|nr:OsmC-like protein [Polychytrium aggregatum]KAI9199248.1 OsmC-like protein [Polychytrium aggregatum]